MSQKIKPKFKNTHNQNVWLSRSNATVGIVFAKCDDNVLNNFIHFNINSYNLV